MELKKATTDSIRVGVLVALSRCYSGADPERSRSYARQALAIPSPTDPEQASKAHYFLALSYLDQDEYRKALTQFEACLKIAEGVGFLQYRIQALAEMSNCHGRLGTVEAAFNTAFEALRLADSIDNYALTGNLNNKIGELYRMQNDTDNAVEHLKKAYEDFSEANIIGGMMATKFNLALAYMQTEPEQALYVLEEGLEEFQGHLTPLDSTLIYGNLGKIHLNLKRYTEAEEHLLKNLELLKYVQLPESLAYCYRVLTELYVLTDRPSKAIIYGRKGLELANELGNLRLRQLLSQYLAHAYAAVGKHDRAYGFLQDHLKYQDSIRSMEKIQLSNELKVKYETERKEQENLLLKKDTALKEASLSRQRILIWVVIGILLVITAISLLTYRSLRAKKRFALQIESLQTSQSRWFTNIAHELRTPLTLVLGPLKNILKKDDILASVKVEASMAHKNGEQLLQRVNEILDVSLMDSGRLALRQVPTNVSVLIIQVVASFQSLAQQKSISLTSSCDGMVFMEVDREKLRNILNNLVANALKFTHDGGEVQVVLEQPQETVEIWVSDTGIGIPQKDLPHIFDRFYQVFRSKEVDYGGSGVGLALSQELARMHGGELTATSEESKGSTFTLSLPVALVCEVQEAPSVPIEETGELPETAVMTVNGPEGERPKVLLVEDHPDMRHYIRKLLQGHYQVIEAVDGLDALERLQKVTPDLIISDVMMPRMDGITLAKHLKEDSSNILTPFITLTAHANERDKLTALRIGVDDYLVKPFDPEELLVRVKNLIDNARVRQQMLEENQSTLEEEIEAIPTYEEQWVRELEEEVRTAMANPNYSVGDLAAHATTSERNLRRNLKRATGLSPVQFIREIRLQQALLLLETRQYATIAEVAQTVGIEDTAYFSSQFKKRFGKTPSSFF